MKPINKAAQRIFDQLTAGLQPGQDRKLDNAPGAYMALHVERLTATTYSLAHYYEQCGDLVPDPDMEFWRAETGAVFPIAIQHATGYYSRAIEFDADGKPAGIRPRTLRELCSFAAMWLKNIKAQQLTACACYRGSTCDVSHDPAACSCGQCATAEAGAA
mgnify:CR=1 FL=1